MMSKTFAPAKINLCLNVTGQRSDGYHLLDSIVVFADVGDRVRVMPADRISLEVTGPMAAGVPADDSNLVVRAAKLFDLPVATTL
ncbi:MAG TPA: 4-(cytidine 5'-diphospho)-2-C-methyl-D-erythritol kinase, partial [Aliiroseovarius sp.]|nr:4-(cytidine 5'-diphospho)-2-C-methyl-D-erythritol kinase [Aliiroseovarius sp.]